MNNSLSFTQFLMTLLGLILVGSGLFLGILITWGTWKMIHDPSSFHLVTQVMDMTQHLSLQAKAGHLVSSQNGFDLTIGAGVYLLVMVLFLMAFIHMIASIIIGFISQGVQLLQYASSKTQNQTKTMSSYDFNNSNS